MMTVSRDLQAAAEEERVAQLSHCLGEHVGGILIRVGDHEVAADRMVPGLLYAGLAEMR